MEALMSFGIQGPKGDRGPQGIQGPQGPSGSGWITGVNEMHCTYTAQTYRGVKFALVIPSSDTASFPNMLLTRGETWYWSHGSAQVWTPTKPSTTRYGTLALSSSGTLSWSTVGSNVSAVYYAVIYFT